MVGTVGLAPTKAVRPRDLQSLAIAAMRRTQKMVVSGGVEPLAVRPIY